MADSQLYLAQREADARFSSEPNPNRQICFLCGRSILQCDDSGWWYLEDESGWVPTHKSDFTNAYETKQGWICGTACWDNHSVEAAPGLFLLGGAA